MHNMKKFILSLFVLSLVGTAAHAQKVDTLLTKKLPEAPGKEIQVPPAVAKYQFLAKIRFLWVRLFAAFEGPYRDG